MMKLLLLLCLMAIVAYAKPNEEIFPETSWSDYVYPVKRSLRFPSWVQAKLYPPVKRPAFSDFPNWLYADQ